MWEISLCIDSSSKSTNTACGNINRDPKYRYMDKWSIETSPAVTIRNVSDVTWGIWKLTLAPLLPGRPGFPGGPGSPWEKIVVSATYWYITQIISPNNTVIFDSHICQNHQFMLCLHSNNASIKHWKLCWRIKCDTLSNWRNSILSRWELIHQEVMSLCGRKL